MHFKDARQHPAQDRACCTHAEGHPRFPDLRPIGTPDSRSRPHRETGVLCFPVPAKPGNGDSLPASRHPRFPASPFPGNRNWSWGFPGLVTRRVSRVPLRVGKLPCQARPADANLKCMGCQWRADWDGASLNVQPSYPKSGPGRDRSTGRIRLSAGASVGPQGGATRDSGAALNTQPQCQRELQRWMD